jgi:3-dehydroquinate synthase
MHTISVQLENGGYDILVGNGTMHQLAEALAPLVQPSRIIVVTNPSVGRFYAEPLQGLLRLLDAEVLVETIPEGEESKTLQTVERLLDRMVELRLDRNSLLVVLGGGVVGDVAGFAAATFMRGIPYAQVPTTLLAQVDSSIGGKVGVDHPRAKNLIGAFYQPLLVCIDPSVLATLPELQVRNGMAEVIKYGMIADESLFALLERQAASLPLLEGNVREDVIKRCCQIKARIVQQDPHENTGLRMILNYGHTVGHAIEAVSAYARFSHGEAVSMGMMAAAKIARITELISEDIELRQKKLLSAAGLPTGMTGIDRGRLIETLVLDKKATRGKNRFVVPLAVGRAVVRENIPTDVLERALDELMDA